MDFCFDVESKKDKLLIYYYMKCKYYRDNTYASNEFILENIKKYLDEDVDKNEESNALLLFEILGCLRRACSPLLFIEIYKNDRIKNYSPTSGKVNSLLKLLAANEIVIDGGGEFELCDKSKLNYQFQKIKIELDNYKSVYEELKNKTVENIDDTIKMIDKNYEIEDLDYNISNIINDNKKLIEYLKNLVELEGNIYSFRERYTRLVIEREKVLEDYFYDLVKANKIINSEKSNLEKEIGTLKEKISNKPILIEKINVDLPSKPVKPNFNYQKPEQPLLKKVGLFNKKKVEEENRILVQQFELENSEYNKKYKEYEENLQKFFREMDEYTANVKSLEEDAKKRNQELYENELLEFEKNVIEWNAVLEKKNNQMEIFSKSLKERKSEILISTESYKKVAAIEYELNYIIENIKKNIKLKKELYSYNIIYGKYRNIIALSSFLDYFISGRCTAFGGIEGAYNLYEQELRANLIINNMDILSGSLSKIKDNQYYIYNKLNITKNSLELIDNRLLVIDVLQTVQIENLNQIIDKADEAVYDTQVTSYYNNKNTKYVDALTFMQLL